MARKKRKGKSRATRHVRLTCPHCTKSVNVQPPRGFQRSIPCPYCRIPIATSLVTLAEEGNSAGQSVEGESVEEANT